MIGPLRFKLYKLILATITATVVARLISWKQQVDASGVMEWQVFKTMIQLGAAAFVVPIAALALALGAGACCLHRIDSSRETRQRCPEHFSISTLFMACCHKCCLASFLFCTRIMTESRTRLDQDSYSRFNWHMGFPLVVAALWPGLLAHTPGLLFDMNGYGEPEGIMPAAAPLESFARATPTLLKLIHVFQPD